MIELNQLNTLVTVAQANSFSKAAEELNVTQSAISQSIKNLEQKLNTVLFQRSGKKVTLTSDGEKFYRIALEFFSNIEHAMEDIKHDKLEMSGKIRVGTLMGVGKSWLAPRVFEFSKKHPLISFKVELGFYQDLVRDFENNKLDILILPEGQLPPMGEKELLSKETATLVYSKKFQCTKEDMKDLKSFTKLPAILFEDNDPLYVNWCKKKYGSAPKRINHKFVINSHGYMIQAVLAGEGVAVLPTHVVNRSRFKDEFVILDDEFQLETGNFYIVYQKDSFKLKRVEELLKFLKQEKNPLIGAK